MLYLVLSRVGGGKTTYVHNVIADFIRDGLRDIVLLVPEQYSFACERTMLERLGAQDADCVQVLSFSRLAELVCREENAAAKRMQDTQRAVLMSLALEGVAHKLTLYRAQAQKPGVVREMLRIADELRQCAVEPSALDAAAEALDAGLLREKLQDISLILHTYRAQAQSAGFDDTDLLSTLCETLRGQNFFAGKLVVLDGFYGFTGQELAVLEQILKQAGAVYVTLCTDTLERAQDETELFAYTKRSAQKLMTLAKRNNVPIAKPQYLSRFSKFNNFPPKYARFSSEALAALEENLFAPESQAFLGPCPEITLMPAADIPDECRRIAAQAKRLIREKGVRCRDIAVIARHAEEYEAPLRAELKKCGLPIFEDRRHPIADQPLLLMLRGAMTVASRGYESEAVLACLKTGLAGFTVEEVSLLENYCFLWRVNGRQWLLPFTRHPDGYEGRKTEEAAQRLAALDALRERAAAFLEPFCLEVRETDGEGYARAVYRLLERCEAAKHLKTYAKALEDAGETDAAGEQDRVWETLMQLLDLFVQLLTGKHLRRERFQALFELMLSFVTLGSIPQGLDEISIGSADRIRIAAPRYIFAAGVNEEIFPAAPVTGGVFHERDRRTLAELGLELSASGAQRVAQERFYVYNALCAAREGLFVSCRRRDAKGAELSPSHIYERVRMLFPGAAILSEDDPLASVESTPGAFEQLARLYGKNTQEEASLRAVLAERLGYPARLAALEMAAQAGEFHIDDAETATELFGREMKLSASRVESHSLCAFRYFCEYALSAKPRREAALDARLRGSLLHYVLELLFSVSTVEALDELDAAQRLTRIRQCVTRYREEVLADEAPDAQLLAVLERNTRALAMLLDRLLAELRESRFRPVAFELGIGMEDGIAPYSVMGEDGVSVQIRGKIDRVDTAQINGKTYVRIVDYKAGGLSLKLSDVLDGLNLQMLIYLFALWKNGGARLADGGGLLPAGVLYQKAAPEPQAASRGEDADTRRQKSGKALKAEGLLLADLDVILAMEKDGGGLYIPAKAKGEALSGSLISLAQFGTLNREIDKLLLGMAKSLHGGNIAAFPVYQQSRGGNKTCAYCDFASVCFHEADSPVRMLCGDSHADVLKHLDELEKEGDGNGERAD